MPEKKPFNAPPLSNTGYLNTDSGKQTDTSSALRIYSPEYGFLSEEIQATDIKSHAHARKIGPFVHSKEKDRQVYWVNWGAPKKNGHPRICYFRHYPRKNTSISDALLTELIAHKKEKRSDRRHAKAQEYILKALEILISEGKHLPWHFNDPTTSDFTISGDVLAGAENVMKEHPIHIPLLDQHKKYILDLAIIGKKIFNHNIILAGIEIEYTHRFTFLKSMLCKSIGFPLISIDIRDITSESEINLEWAKSILMQTTANSEDGLRKNYIDIHRTILPIYIDIPRRLISTARHQYVIFAKETDKLITRIEKLKLVLNLSGEQVLLHKVVATNQTTITEIENAGNLAGCNWREYNSNTYIKLTVDKPISKTGNLYYFHLILGSLCNAHFETLIGYKYKPGARHWDSAPLFWEEKDRETQKTYRLAPKRLSEPIMEILQHTRK